MDRKMNLKDIIKEIDSIIGDLKVGQNTTDFPVKWENDRKRLLEIRKLLKNDSAACTHNLSILERSSSERLQDALQIAGIQRDKVQKALSAVNSALDYCHHIKAKYVSAAKTAETSSYDDLENDAYSKSTSDITSQTIALIDAGRYETATGHEIIIEYPKPDLGVPTYQRNCNIAEKIRIGLGSSGRGKGNNYQVTMPKCYHEFCGGKV
jgi:hypothetical protein